MLVANWQAQPWQKRILVAVDDSLISETVNKVALQISKVSNLPVTVLSGISTESQRDKEEQEVPNIIGLLHSEVIVGDARVVSGKTPDRAIIETAEDIGSDLVIFGNGQRKGLPRKIAGRTTDRVLLGLSCAVLVVKRAPEPSSLVAAVRKQA